MLNKCFAVLLSVCCLATFGADTTTQKSEGDNKNIQFTTMKADKFVFSYAVDGETLVAELSYPTAGWVAVGFNPTKMMKNGNFILATVVDGKPVLSDDYGVSEWSHKPDTEIGGKNNIINGNCTVKDGIMTVSFMIPLNSTDAKDVVLEKGKPIKVVLAAGKKPDLKSIHSALSKITITL